jgi:hypothetical protein
MKQSIIIIVGLLILAAAIFFFVMGNKTTMTIEQPKTEETTTPPPAPEPAPAPEEVTQEPQGTQPVEDIGVSAGGEDITAYHYGTGDKELLFIGGIHGGYEWNTVLVARELMNYLAENPSAVPDDLTVTVIPVLNPDGLKKIVGTTGDFTRSDVPTAANATVPGRFNAHSVDLNRNFDCEWKASGMWQNQTVSGGSAPFSEPESAAIRKYVSEREPAAVVVWYSAAGGVYSSSCNNGVSAETKALTNVYANASGYKAYEQFDFYEITGDMVNWLAGEGIPAISVLLTNHTDTEWTKNKKGIDAVIESLSK